MTSRVASRVWAPFQRRALSSVVPGSVSGYGNNRVCTVLGAQWGDEGKGKLVDILAQKYDVVARFNGGANAGHTLVVDGKKFAFHLLPCGLLGEKTMNVIGNGVVLHVPTLFDELSDLDDASIDYNGRLLISDRAHILFDFHKIVDGLHEQRRSDASDGKGLIGTTKRGIGPCYASKATRNGLRVGDLRDWDEFCARYRFLLAELQDQYGFEYDGQEELARFAEYRLRLEPMMADTVHYLNRAVQDGRTVLAEGANAALLDIDFGTYPYVTSSSTTVGGISTGLGIAGSKVDCRIGVVKAYTTRVGAGPFPTELDMSQGPGHHLLTVGHEKGTTTGRNRRCGWLDIPVVQYSTLLNDYTSINITKLDVLDELDEILIGVQYKLDGKALEPGQMPSTLDRLADCQVQYETLPGWKTDISGVREFDALPDNAKSYLSRIEELIGVPVSWVGVGAGRNDMAVKGFSVPK